MDPQRDASDGRSGTLPRPADDLSLDLGAWERYLSTYDQHGSHLYRLAMLLLDDERLAEDAVFDVFMAAHAPWRDGRIEDLGTNLRRALVHRVLTSRRHRSGAGIFGRRHRPGNRGETVDAALTEALHELPPEARAAGVLHYYEGLSVAETAAWLGTDDPTARSGLGQMTAALLPTAGVDPDPIDAARLTVFLRDQVDDLHPAPELRVRLRNALDAATPRRASAPVLPIVAALVVAIVAVSALISHRNGGGIDVVTEPSASESTAATPPTVAVTTSVTTARTASTAAAGSLPGPTVLTVDPDDPCRDSTDPACGAFRWDPEPVNQPATLILRLPDAPIVVGRDYELRLEMRDPDGPVDLGCYSVDADRPALSLGSCSQESRPPCPERFGPWTPPPGSPGNAQTATVIQFQRSGPYVVEVSVVRPDGCDNVDPYRSGARATLAVDVVDASG